jgi:integrase
MATVKKQGRGYQITVSFGSDGNGRRHREYMTWVPGEKMTESQIEKELNRQAVLFEERVRSGKASVDGSIRFSAWAEKFLAEYAAGNLKPHTVARYAQQLERINQAIGHIKLKELKPGHISKFYANLQEEGIRDTEKATLKIDLAAWCRARSMTVGRLCAAAGASEYLARQLKKGCPISSDKARAVAGAMGEKVEDVFTFERDMTPLMAASIHSYHATLSTVLSRAVEQGYITQNPATGVKLPKADAPEPAYLDEPEARRLLELLQAEPIQWRAVITFDLLSGLRRGEILGLRWCDVDFDGQLLRIRQTWNYVPNKGCYVDTPKSRTSARPLKISRSAVLLLLEVRRWQDERRALMGDAWTETDGRVFVQEDGRPFFPDSLTQWFHRFVQRNGLPDVHVHSLRHTYASMQIADGIPLVVVSHNLGHAKPSTTSNIYAHVIASAEAKAAEVMDRFSDVILENDVKVALKSGKEKTAG